MDGVVANFWKYVRETHKPIIKGKRDWSSMGRDWWASVPPFEGCREFYLALKELASVTILTGAIGNPGCHSGKCDWLIQHLYDGVDTAIQDAIICNKKHKYLLAAPDRILIDDNDRMVREWREAGGIAIQHYGIYKDTLEKVRGVFDGV